jgi:four helix bundle protein
MKDFHNLMVWERAHKLTLSIYKLTKEFPKDELYGLTNQMRRSSSSIPSNIAEGCGRDSQAELSRFLQMAMGSSSELEYQIILSHDLKYMDDNVFLNLSEELNQFRRMLNSFIQKIKRDNET